MRGVEHVVFGFFSPQESAKPVILSYCRKLIAAAGQDLVRIRLMPDVDDQLVARRVKRVVQSHQQLDRSQACARMAADL